MKNVSRKAKLELTSTTIRALGGATGGGVCSMDKQTIVMCFPRLTTYPPCDPMYTNLCAPGTQLACL